jgi:hypothetical protein
MAEEVVEEVAEEEVAETLLTEETPEVKKEETDSPADVKADDAPDKKTEGEERVIPEEYEFKMPEGVELDTAKAEEFSVIAKEMELTQDGADKFVGLYVKAQADAIEAQRAAWDKQLSDWREASTNDDEMGGAGFQKNVGMAKKALDIFGNQELREVLNTSGMGNHPEVLRLLSKVGEAASDDSFVFGKTGVSEKKSAADILFPNQGKS